MDMLGLRYLQNKQENREINICIGGLLLRKIILTEDLNLGIVNIKKGFE